jgi:propanol-preferring alcohol dehydrogenase
VPAANEVGLRILACGVCRTDLHLLDGDLPAHRPRVIPGHEIVGIVDQLGSGCTRFRLGDSIGVTWFSGTCGVCRFSLRGDENLCLDSRLTSWNADGGHAEHAVVAERFADAIPDKFTDREAAPLSAPGSSGTEPCEGRHCRTAAGSAPYGSARPRTSLHRWRSRRAPRCT